MPRKAPNGSQIVSVRLPEELLQRLDRYLDWSETSRRVKSSRNAALREALRTWLDHQEQLVRLLHPDTLRPAIPAARFKILYDPISSAFQHPVARL
jgi:hypothetical protein